MSTEEQPAGRRRQAEIEVTASPEEVWRAIATGDGNAGWIFPAEIESREGGAVVLHRAPYGPDASGTVTAWDPPHRFGYEERLPAMGGTEPLTLGTEYLVEARRGGTCVVRVVSSLSGDLDGWEDLLDGTTEGWRMSLRVLRAYLAHFAGQPVAHLDATVRTSGGLQRAEAWEAFGQLLGLAGRSTGDAFRTADDAPPLSGTVEYADASFVLLRSDQPGPGLFALSTLPMDGVTVSVNVLGRFYGGDADALTRRARPRWIDWLTARVPSMTLPETPDD